jgi:hypothetical protein
MNTLNKNHLVVVDNFLITAFKDTTVTQNRFIDLYLSKVNPGEKATRNVAFSLKEYCEIMEIANYNLEQLKQSITDIQSIKIELPVKTKRGELYKKTVPFPDFTLTKIDGEYYITANCSELMAERLFNLTGNFTDKSGLFLKQ